jgi:hypothetical protein
VSRVDGSTLGGEERGRELARNERDLYGAVRRAWAAGRRARERETERTHVLSQAPFGASRRRGGHRDFRHELQLVRCCRNYDETRTRRRAVVHERERRRAAADCCARIRALAEIFVWFGHEGWSGGDGPRADVRDYNTSKY